MKTESTIRKQHQHIIELLCNRRLKDAINELHTFVTGISDSDLSRILEQAETSYSYMLQYMRNDIADPERNRLFHKILTDLMNVADQARIQHEEMLSSRSYFKVRNELRTSEQPYTPEAIILELESYTENAALAGLLKDEGNQRNLKELRQRHEAIQPVMFSTVWTNSAWNEEEEKAAEKILNSVLIPTNDMCLYISAVTMSLLECFDLHKLLFLFDAYQHQENQVNQRALVGIALIFNVYHNRLSFYPEIKARLNLLNEDEKFGQDLNRIQIQLIQTQDTEKISKKMRDEIIPEMIKTANIHATRIRPEDTDEDTDDYNPDWSKELENSPLGDKLREMSELQMEGADVYMSTFAQLKQYPFFKTMSNWFYPFDKQHSSVVEELGDDENSILNLIIESGFFCDNDKYSLCFTIMHIPKSQRDAMVSQMTEQQLGELMDEQKISSIKKTTGRPEIITNQYLHNLYRFFKLYARRHEFYDIFDEPISLYRYEILKPILRKTDLLQELAHHCFRKEHFGEAIEIYNQLLEMNGLEAEIYQKLGFCYQKQRRYTAAIDSYLKADMIKPDNVWTNRRLATCYRITQAYAKAIEYYQKVEQVQPENRSLLFNIGSCLAELERYDEALKYFFKLDFINPDNLKTWRAIAWCSFIGNKPEQAQNYYQKILEKNGDAADYLNAGHTAWSQGDIHTAIERYTQSYARSENKALFLDTFNKDKEYLIKYGISEDDIALMYDIIS